MNEASVLCRKTTQEKSHAMQINPYLAFSGQCEEAFRFYEKLLGGKITFLTKYGESPMTEQAGPEWRDKVMHVAMGIDGSILMGADALPQYFEKPQGMSVSLTVKSAEEAKRIFNGLAENAVVQMPLQKTFWSSAFGVLTDRFGTPWIVNCEEVA